MSDEEKVAVDQWVSLPCPRCGMSAYDVNLDTTLTAPTTNAAAFRKTDPNALDLRLGDRVACPYCGAPLMLPTVYPIIGGGYEVEFTMLGVVGKMG